MIHLYSECYMFVSESLKKLKFTDFINIKIAHFQSVNKIVKTADWQI